MIPSSLKRAIHEVLDRTGLYERLEWSPLHRLFVWINNPTYERSQAAEAAFYAEFVRRGMLVFDVGANFGSKSEVFLRLGARVVAFEPDRRCASALRRRFALSRRHTVVEAACGGAEGKQSLYIESSGSAFNTLSQKWRDAAHHGDGGKVDVNERATAMGP